MGRMINTAVRGSAPLAEPATFATAKVAPDVVLDSRLALYHQSDRWLAVADLHYGYELNRCLDGGLYPLWGMNCIAERLEELVTHYEPVRLILMGDIMDGRGSVEETHALVSMLRERTEVLCLMGNHDSPLLRRSANLVESHCEEQFFFHHGHDMEAWLTPSQSERTHVTGHLHPAHVFTDGAGLRLKLPAFVQKRLVDSAEDSPAHWIMPAFSPWASGCRMTSPAEDTQIHVLHRTRILKLQRSGGQKTPPLPAPASAEAPLSSALDCGPSPPAHFIQAWSQA